MTILNRPSPNCNPRLPGQDVRLIVLHATVGSAASSLAWLRNPLSTVSTGYLIDRLGTTYRLVNEDWIAWHAGAGRWQGITDLNAHSIGIELENKNDGKDPWTPAQFEAAQILTAGLLQRHRLTADAIVLHSMIALPPGRKTDPAGFPLAAFRARLGGGPVPYRVSATDGANVRQGPRRSFPVAGEMPHDAAFPLGSITVGERINGDARWAWRADGLGFVHMSCLEAL